MPQQAGYVFSASHSNASTARLAVTIFCVDRVQCLDVQLLLVPDLVKAAMCAFKRLQTVASH